MALPKEPVVKKFFTNKIESTRDDWYGYLVQIARIFYTLDGEEYNRDILMNKFATMSGRDATRAQRDSSNFRDEFGAYGTYLGVYHLEQRDGKWYVFVSDAAKKFLCCQNPNAAAFCRSQLSLFQYPNGAGAGISANGGQSVQGNIKADTLREIQNGIRLNPLRLICKIVVGEIEIKKKKFSDIAIPYSSIFCMVNDSRINQNYNPPVELVSSVFSEYCATGDNVEMNLEGLTNFKRNFHILEKTGLFTRDSKFGLLLAQRNYAAAYECIKVIADMDVFFDGFENLYDAPDEDGVRDVIVADGLFCREIDGLFCRSSPDIIVRRRCVLSHKRRGWLQPSPSFRYSRNLALQDELYHPVINNGPAVLVCVDKRLGTGPVNQSRDAG